MALTAEELLGRLARLDDGTKVTVTWGRAGSQEDAMSTTTGVLTYFEQKYHLRVGPTRFVELFQENIIYYDVTVAAPSERSCVERAASAERAIRRHRAEEPPITDAQAARMAAVRATITAQQHRPTLDPAPTQAQSPVTATQIQQWIQQSMTGLIQSGQLNAQTAQHQLHTPTHHQHMPADEMASMWAFGQAVAQGIAGQNSTTHVLAQGLSVHAVQYPWTVFSAVHWLPEHMVRQLPKAGDVTAWRTAMNRARMSAEFFIVPKTVTGKTERDLLAATAASVSIMKVNLLEDNFEQLLKLYAKGQLQLFEKEDLKPLFVAGAALLEAIITAKNGWHSGGCLVTRNFLTAWEQGVVDWSKLVKFR